jgi:hypothetical protein
MSDAGRSQHAAAALHCRALPALTLDEVTVARGVDDGDHVLGRLELPQGNVDRDAALALGLQLVEHPGVLERALAELGSLLLEL